MKDLAQKAWALWERWLSGRSPRRTDIRGAARTLPVLAFTLAWAAMGLGALHLKILVVAAAGAALAAVLALESDEDKLNPAAVLLFALGAWSLLQACPLPLTFLRVIAPKNAQIWTRAFELTGVPRRWASISLDPGSSVVESLKWTSYGAAAIAGGYVAKQLGLRVIAGLTFLLAILVAATTFLHGLLHAHALYGLYVPTFDPGPWGFGPILNPNNRSGYLNLGAFAGLALLVSRDYRGRRWPVVLGVGCLVAVSVLAHSRGGLGALAAGSLVLVVMFVRKALTRNGARRQFYLRAAVPPFIALVGGVTLAALGADTGSWDALRNEGLSKLHVVWWTRPMLEDFPFFGVGRGAFETVFPAYRLSGANTIHHHAENFVMDWIIDWGLLAAVPALIAFGSMIRKKREEQPSRFVLRLALAVLLLQNLVDHGLEMPAIAMLASVIVAALAANLMRTAAAPEVDTNDVVPVKKFVLPRRATLGTAIAALVLGALFWGRHSAFDDRRILSAALHELPSNDVEDARMLLDKIAESVVRHPGDAFVPLLGAITARHVPGAHPVQWLGWALERDMMSGHAHLAVAYFLLKVHAINQALSELRVASERDASVRTRAAEWAVLYTPEPDDVLRVVPDGPDGVTMLLSLANTERFQSRRFELLESATEHDPSSMPARTRAARAYLDALQNAEGSACHFSQQSTCIEHLNKHILTISHLDPKNSLATELTARMLAATGRAAEARALLSSTCSSFPKPARCWQVRIELARGEVADESLQAAIRAYYATACNTDDDCIRACLWLAAALGRRGDHMGALEYYNRAVRAGSDNPITWAAIAQAARAAGQPRRAMEALRRAQQAGGNSDLVRAVDRARLESLAAEPAASTSR
jgi:tetratricopeptide (TPR) repeat protein